MEIRYLTKNDFYQLRGLLDEVFSKHNGKRVSFARLFPRLFGEENSFAPESHIGAFIDGKLVGTAAMYPIDYVVGGRHIRLVANGNVAVDEAYRGRGIMSAMLEEINRQCDKCADLCYLHGNAARYGRFGYVADGVEYRLTVQPGKADSFSFRPMEQADVPVLNVLSRQKPDYVVRRDEDFIAALRSGGREAVTVLDGEGQSAGYLSFHREKGHIEEYAFASDWEARIFPQIACSSERPITVKISGYDPAAVERCKAVAEIEKKQPALFRNIQPQMLQEAAEALGLDSGVLYAPYLT